MTKLKTYLKERGIRQRKFAREIGISEPALSLICSGSIKPGLETATKIELATKGAIRAGSWWMDELTGKCA